MTFIEGITGQHNETQQYSVLVLKSSKYEKIDYSDYTFEVMDLEGRRISRIKVQLHDK